MTEQKVKKIQLLINYLFLATVVAAVLFSFYKYYHTKDYDFRVEASCDPTQEICFYRACETDPEECLPNELSNYKVFLIKAYDFSRCADNSCKQECEEGELMCEPVMCDPDAGDECTAIASEE